MFRVSGTLLSMDWSSRRKTPLQGKTNMITMAQALAQHIRLQIQSGEKVLQAAGDEHHGAVFGNPVEVLSVVGNVSDVAHTNHLWLVEMLESGALQGELDENLRRDRPGNLPDAVAFVGPRETDSPAQAKAQLRRVNEKIAFLIEGLSDADLEKPVNSQFLGQTNLRDVLFAVIEHGSLHIGQAWGILKGKGVAS